MRRRPVGCAVVGQVLSAPAHSMTGEVWGYCDSQRELAGQGPVPYPVACLPQAWSSGSVFMLLQASLGVRIDGRRKEVHIERPLLPIGIESLSIRDLPVGDVRIDLEFHRIGEEVVAVPAKHVDGGVRVLAHL
jgi:glycogen debranching enzyme